jgi:hypothetical protein
MSKFNLRNLFLVHSIFAFALALGLLLGAETILRLYRLSTGNTEKLMAQFFGGSLVAIGVIAWFARETTDLKARDGMAISLFLSAVISFVIALLATLGKVLRDGGWPTVIVFLAFALSYAYLQFIKRGEQ